MSRHNKWSKIKGQKAIDDKKKGAAFTRVVKNITVAVKEKGSNPATNFKLRLAMDQAKSVNMPKENIERAIERASGGAGGGNFSPLLFEGFTPGGAAIIIETLSDNSTRTSNEIKLIFSKHGGSLGAVKWMFDYFGVLAVAGDSVKDKDNFELQMIEAGANDIKEEEGSIIVYTKPHDLEKIKNAAEAFGAKVDYAGLNWVAKEKIALPDTSKETLFEQFLELLDESEEVGEYYTNIL